jgi:ABC-type cobalamin/Fe3+-siderophores transport system ATPase subunit
MKLIFQFGNLNSDRNVFTTIVGKNGSGKSRMLKEIIELFREKKKIVGNVQSSFSLEDESLIGDLPRNIIASSTSPFDKFPFNDRATSDGYYSYQGLRGLYSNNLSLSFMTRTLGGLIRAMSLEEGRVKTVLDVLDYLEYHKVLEARFITEMTRNTLGTLAYAKDPLELINEMLHGKNYGGNEFRKVVRRLEDADDYTKKQIVYALRLFLESFSDNRISIVLTENGIVNMETSQAVPEDFSLLLEYGFLRLRDITLHKKGHDESFRINDASSGEQCVVMSILGIASRIKDYSLICIDEPEICLHPQWQERYIELMMSTFEAFKGCHFLIATHSPQIISRLGDECCFVLDMQSGNTLDAKALNKRSADFQLAHVFGAPGFKNECLMREVLEALTNISSGKKISSTEITYLHALIESKELLDIDDPVTKLILLLEQGLEALANV